MEALRIQFKNVMKDKFVLISALLPLVMAIVIKLSGGFADALDMHIAVLQDNLPTVMEQRLEQSAVIGYYENMEKLHQAIANPAIETIGIVFDANSDAYTLLLQGNESSLTRASAQAIEVMLRKNNSIFDISTIIILPNADSSTLILSVLVILMALFLGCTFNTMNIVTEKEDGVSFIHEVIPISQNQYLMQKTVIGFIGSLLVSLLTALILTGFREHTLLLLLLISLAALMASLTGLYLGTLSDSLITAIICIKVILVLFIAVPLAAYLFVEPGAASVLLNLLPSFPVFDGLLSIMQGESMYKILSSIAILALHCIVWYLLYIYLLNKRKNYSDRCL